MTNERGAGSLLVLAIVAVAIVTGMLLADVAVYLGARARAQAAADAAALAAAPVTFRPYGSGGDPVAEAAGYAEANGAVLTECRCRIDRTWRVREVAVAVHVPVDLLLLEAHGATATSRAEFTPTQLRR